MEEMPGQRGPQEGLATPGGQRATWNKAALGRPQDKHAPWKSQMVRGTGHQLCKPRMPPVLEKHGWKMLEYENLLQPLS